MAESRQLDIDVDHYPDLERVFATILQDPEIPGTDIERVEVTCLASGEMTCRVWQARAEEHIGRYYAPENLPRQ